MPATSRTASGGGVWCRRSSAIEGVAAAGRTPREIDAFRSASRSISSTDRPVAGEHSREVDRGRRFSDAAFGVEGRDDHALSRRTSSRGVKSVPEL